MFEVNQVLLDATKVDKNNRLFTKEAWEGIINSEQNKNHMIPILCHLDLANEELPSNAEGIPADKLVGTAECSWFGEDINVNMVLTDDFLSKTKRFAFMPAFTVDADGIQHINSIDVVESCSLVYFFGCDDPAIDVKFQGAAE